MSTTSGDDDWRTTIEIGDDHHRSRFVGAVSNRRLAREARAKVGDRVIVTHDGPHLFFYTDSETGARMVEELAHELLEEHELQGTVTVTRWHPLEERWEDAGVALPATDEERAAELARSGEDDRELSESQGFPEWDVRLMFPTREGAVAFAASLTAEGIPVARGGSALAVGADTEQEANALAERLRALAPKDVMITVEVNRAEAWGQAHPFAFLGGLAN